MKTENIKFSLETMHIKKVFQILILFFFISCGRAEKKKLKSDVIETKKKTQIIDFFKVLNNFIKPDYLLFKQSNIEFDNLINSFISRNKTLFAGSKLSREYIYKSQSEKLFMYVKEFVFDDSQNIKKITKQIDLGVYSEKEIFEGEVFIYKFDEIKPPHDYYIYGNKLYLFYLNAEGYRKHLNKIMKVVKNENFRKELYSH